MLHRFEVTKEIIEAMIAGHLNFSVQNNLGRNVQRGDMAHFEELAGAGAIPRIVRCLVTFVSNWHQRRDYVVLGLRDITNASQSALMEYDFMSAESRATSTQPAWERAGFRSEDERNEYNRLTKLIKENSVRNAPLSMQKRAKEFLTQRDAIDPKSRRGEHDTSKSRT